MRSKLILAIIVFGAVAAVQADPDIHGSVTISSGTPPPPVVRQEPLPPPRPSFVWVQGYWSLSNHRYEWVPGRWERARAGFVYVQPEWREGPGGWEFRQGGWRNDVSDREQDHDRDSRSHCPPGHRRKGEC